MWRMLQQLFSRKPRSSVATRLRLQVEALENRLVPSASNLGGLLLPPAQPSHLNLGSAFKTETKIQDHATKQDHVAKKGEVDLGSALKSGTKQDHVGKKIEVGSGSAHKSL